MESASGVGGISKSIKDFTRVGNFFSCNDYRSCLRKNDDRKVHQRVHAVKKLFSCSKCGEHFTWKSSLRRHDQFHADQEKDSCNESEKCRTSHTKEKPFSCNDCDKCFSDNDHLKTHQRIHRGEKSFACNECRKCFSQKSHLIKHQRLHTDEKSFKCNHCGRCFIQETHLIKHLLVHTDTNHSLALSAESVSVIKVIF